jgi:integrase/recombinase XerD
LAAYLQWLTAHHYASDTVKKRRQQLQQLLDWCELREVRSTLAVNRELLERYQGHLARRPSQSHTSKGGPTSIRYQHEQLVSLRSWFRWLTRQRYLLYNPAAELELPRVPERLPSTILSEQDVDAILREPDVQRPLGVRDRSMLETFYSSGLRRMELAGLTMPEVDLENRLMCVRQGKRRKDRLVPLGERARRWLERYLVEVRPQLLVNPDEQAVYLTRYGAGFAATSLSLLVGRYVRRALAGKAGSCHILRHAMASGMLDHGADVRVIQSLLGHASITTTQLYTHTSIAQLQRVHDSTHPAEQRPQCEV